MKPTLGNDDDRASMFIILLCIKSDDKTSSYQFIIYQKYIYRIESKKF